MNKRQVAILPLILPLALAALACSVFVGGPTYPEAIIPVSTEDAGIVEKQFSEAATSAATSGVPKTAGRPSGPTGASMAGHVEASSSNRNV